ncbi:hypothetical protein [Paenibacillus macerans]|uniref:hypothetical protein n=1 Tax=Paenibacillus macerans TaxID=44252 RepID=UPI001BCFAA42|nr:hypothetical protein [Paenibacillus macerans]
MHQVAPGFSKLPGQLPVPPCSVGLHPAARWAGIRQVTPAPGSPGQHRVAPCSCMQRQAAPRLRQLPVG